MAASEVYLKEVEKRRRELVRNQRKSGFNTDTDPSDSDNDEEFKANLEKRPLLLEVANAKLKAQLEADQKIEKARLQRINENLQNENELLVQIAEKAIDEKSVAEKKVAEEVKANSAAKEREEKSRKEAEDLKASLAAETQVITIQPLQPLAAESPLSWFYGMPSPFRN